MGTQRTVDVVVPRLGWSMDEGTFVEWLKEDGQQVNVGDMLFVLEGEKAAQEVESFDAGILRLPPNAPAPGDIVRVGQLLGCLVAEGQAAPFESREESEDEETGSGKAVLLRQSHLAISPPSQGRSDSSLAAGAPGILISPRARRVASELNVDLSGISGTGREGRIREQDIRAAWSNRLESRPDAAEKELAAPSGRIIPITRIRRTIAEQMSAGVHRAAPVTLSRKTDASNLVALRRQIKSSELDDAQPSYTSLILKFTALAIDEHPMIAAQWRDEGIFVPDRINIAFAVETDKGLFAPVIFDVTDKTLSQIAAESRALISTAQDGRLRIEQIQGGVITVTNLGAYGVDAFTPIINLPQSAILGVGRFVHEPVVVGEAIEIRDTVALSLTFDHRVIDGAPAARFLEYICKLIADPSAALTQERHGGR